MRAALAAMALGVVVALAAGTPASARVTVQPPEAAPGGYVTLAFRVPSEKDTASTVQVEVILPTATPIANVSVPPVPGWTVQLDEAPLDPPVQTGNGELTMAPSRITWTATSADAAVGPGAVRDFEVTAGPLPDADEIVLKVLQTYSDGDVVRWIEEQPPNRPAVEHPAPVLTLTAPPAAVTVGSPSARTKWLDIAALLVGLAGLLVASLAWGRRGAPEPARSNDRESATIGT